MTIVNACTQFDHGRERRQADYDAIRSAFKEVALEFGDKRIGFPMIGAGLAGGDWKVVSKIIEEELEDLDHTVVIYKLG